MSVAKIKKINIIAHNDSKKEILEFLFDRGFMEILPAKDASAILAGNISINPLSNKNSRISFFESLWAIMLIFLILATDIVYRLINFSTKNSETFLILLSDSCFIFCVSRSTFCSTSIIYLSILTDRSKRYFSVSWLAFSTLLLSSSSFFFI